MAVELRVLAADGNYGEILPDWSDLTFSQDLIAPGSLTFNYPTAGGRHANWLAHGNQFVVLIDGVEPRNGRFTYDEGSGSRIAESDGGTSTYACKSNLSRFEKLMLAPGFGSVFIGLPTSPELVFDNLSPGAMAIKAIGNAMSRANARSTKPTPWLTHPLTRFTNSTDSTSTAWGVNNDMTFEIGDSAMTVLQFLIDSGFAEPAMDKKDLLLFKPTTNGTNLTLGNKPVVLQTGRDFTEATYETSSAELVNALLVIGEKPIGATSEACVWVYDTASINTYGYREGKINVSGADQPATLTNIGNAYLANRKDPRWSYTYAVSALYLEQGYGRNFPGGIARPFLDYKVGDSILILDGAATSVQRVRLLSATWPDARAATVNITVNDWFAERQEEIEKRLKYLE